MFHAHRLSLAIDTARDWDSLDVSGALVRNQHCLGLLSPPRSLQLEACFPRILTRMLTGPSCITPKILNIIRDVCSARRLSAR